MKRITLEPWTAFDKHCLTSAVSRVGDQNWTAVSRQTKNIYEECNKYLSLGEKKSEWFSNKQCAAQYEHLLKNVPPRRKKRVERTPEQGAASESPAEILQQTSRHEFIEELKRTIAEEQALYLKLFKEYEDIKAGRLDHKLEEIQEEYDAKEREKEIKLKLKFKLGEKSMAETPSAEHDRPTPTADTPTTPTKTETPVGHEAHKTSVTTSPLLTSLLQSPSPLTRPSSATPTISLLLNSSPSVPSNESPTLSRLLESSCPTPVPAASSQLPPQSGSSTSASQRLLSTPQPPRPQLTPTTPLSALASDLPNPPSVHPAPPSSAPTPTSDSLSGDTVPNPDAAAGTTELSKETVAEIAALQEELMQTAETMVSEKTTSKMNSGASEVAGSSDKPLDEKKRGVPRRLDLENIEVEEEDSTESQVLETVEEMIEKVQTAIIETVGNSSSSEGTTQDLPNAAESETATTEDHSLDTLELTSDAVQLIVVGPDRQPNYEVAMKDDESKGDAIEDVPDIDEIQPSLSASDIAQIQEPLKDQDTNPQDGNDAKEEETIEEIQSPPVTIEQAEADLASITREEENDDTGETVTETPEEDLTIKEAVVVVERVEDVKLDESKGIETKESADAVPLEPEPEPEPPVTESQETQEDEAKKNVDELPKEDVEETGKSDDVKEQSPVVESKVEPKGEVERVSEQTKVEPKGEVERVSEQTKVEPKGEVERVSEQTKVEPKGEVERVSERTKAETEYEGDAQERDSVPSKPPVEVEDVTMKNTTDSYVEKPVIQEEDNKERESEVSEEEKKDELPPPEPMVEPKTEKQKPAEKPPAKKEEKPETSIEDRVEEIRSGKRELRRGRATPPVTSPIVALSERTLREKRPTTPSSSSDGREEPTPRSVKRKRTTNVSESSVPCSPSPSIVSNDDDKDYKAWKKSILLVYDRIAAHKYASVFLKPINENDAPSYFQMIKCPTDLTTIKRHIESGVIRNTVDFQKEMLLMISNAMIYNKSDTLVHKMACEMLPDMKEAMETMVQALGSGVPLDQPDSRAPVTSRVSRASVSAKGQGAEDSGLPSSSGPASAKRKRHQPPEDTRSKRKRSEAS